MVDSMSDSELELQLREAGRRLTRPPSSVEELFTLLDEIDASLSRVDQSPSESMQNALSPVMKALFSSKLLKHSDTDVKVAVASCFSEITRITAPDLPYNDGRMKIIFHLMVAAFKELHDMSSQSFDRRVAILNTMAKVRLCSVMLDLDCNGLIVKMFQHFLKAIRECHPHVVFTSMETIMTLVLEENDEISAELLSPLLASVKKGNQDVFPVARNLVNKVLENCATKLKPYLMQALRSMGTSPSDYSITVTKICGVTSDAVEHHCDSAPLEENLLGLCRYLEDVELSMAVNASILSVREERHGWATSHAKPSSSSTQNAIHHVSVNGEIPEMASISSVPPVPEGANNGPIHFPALNPTAINLMMEIKEAITSKLKKDEETSSCVICFDAPIEGACIPCGHMIGCMPCLNGIVAKNWSCPVCRANVDQVIRIYAV